MIKKRYRGKVVLITGASRGIGRATAFDFAREGGTVVLTGLESDAEMLASAAERCAPMTQTATYYLDVRDDERADEVIKDVVHRFGKIDVMVNNAGIASIGSFVKIDPKKSRAMIDVNVFGTVNMIHAVLPVMLRQKHGKIINIASVLGRRGVPMIAVYGATKAAIVGLSETLRAELHGTGVDVISILPNAANTDLVRPILHLMKGAEKVLPEPEDIALAVVDAADGPAREIYLDAMSRMVMVVNRIAPAFVDKMLARIRPLAEE